MAILYGPTQSMFYGRVFLLVHTLGFPGQFLVVDIIGMYLLQDGIIVGSFVQMMCLSLSHDVQCGRSWHWGV